MELNPAKCSSLSASPRSGVSVVRTKPSFGIGEVWIPCVTNMVPFKYLGDMVDSSEIRGPTLPNLPIWIRNLTRSPLKPHQRLALLRDFIIPKLMYGLQTSRMTGKTLRDADRFIKASVKSFLHLAKTTPDQFLYPKLRDGELGIMDLWRDIPRIFRDRLLRLLNTEDDPLPS